MEYLWYQNVRTIALKIGFITLFVELCIYVKIILFSGIIQCSQIQYRIVHYIIVQHNTIEYSAVLYSTVQYRQSSSQDTTVHYSQCSLGLAVTEGGQSSCYN